jgi:hypothetical protein
MIPHLLLTQKDILITMANEFQSATFFCSIANYDFAGFIRTINCLDNTF